MRYVQLKQLVSLSFCLFFTAQVCAESPEKLLQALDGYLLVPLLFSEVVNLHPVAIIIAILIFGGLWGFWGVFFAIPLATLVQAVLNAWPDRDARGEESVADG